MAQEIEVLLTKQFDEVQIDQFAIDWLVRQTAEFGEPGRIAERLRTRGPACPPWKNQGSTGVLRGRAIMTTDTEALRVAARSIALAGINGWGNLCDAADTIDTLSAEKDRLTACLKKANISTEHFEREWYLRGDELDTMRAQLAEAQRELIAKEAQLAEARRDTERLDWIEKIALRKLPSTPRRGVWKFGDELIVGMSLRTAIDAAKGEQS